MAREFPADCSDLDGSEELRKDYIKALLDVSGDDARHVLLFVAVSLAAISLPVTKFPLDRILGLPLPMRLTFVCGLLLLAAGALSSFRYVRAIHITRMGLARCLASADARHARELWAGEEGVYRRKGKFYWYGIWAMGAGFAAVAFVLAYMLLQGR